MKRFLLYLFALSVAIILGVFIAHDPGYSLFAYGHWTIEMPLWLYGLLFLFCLLVAYNLSSLIDGANRLNQRFETWKQQSHQKKLCDKMTLGLFALNLTQWEKAEACFSATIKSSPLPLVNYLNAAYAAHQQQRYVERDQYLQQATDAFPKHIIAIEIVRARLLLAQRDFTAAETLLLAILQKNSKQLSALHLLRRLYCEQQAWQKLGPLLPNFKKQWDEQWIAYYGLYQSDNLTKQLKTAEAWQKAHSDSPGLYLSLGRLCIALQQWREAKNYLLTSVELKPQAVTYKLLAQCYEQMQLPQEAVTACKNALTCMTN